MKCYTLPDGYSAKIINCIDIPIAGAAGFFNYDYYFFYVFFYCLLNNWNDSFLPEFDRIARTLAKLGLIMKSHRVNDLSHLIPQIQEQIQLDHPVLMPVTYRSLFYSPWTYRDPESTGIHLLLACGFDSRKEVVVIRDTTHFAATGIDDDIGGLKDFRRTGLLKLQLTEAMVRDIWVESNQDFLRMNSSYCSTFYSIESIGEPEVEDYDGLLRIFPEACDGERSLLALTVRHMEDLIAHLRSDLFRNVFNSCIFALCDIVKRGIGKTVHGKDCDLRKFEVFERKYMSFRNMITSELSGLSYKNEMMSEDRKEQLVQKILSMDREFSNLIRER